MSDKKIRDVEDLISQFCKIILTQRDNLNEAEAKRYIESLKQSEKDSLLSANFCDRSVYCKVEGCLTDYISQYQGEGGRSIKNASPFEFDTDDNFYNFQIRFKEMYTEGDSKIQYPSIFEKTFEYIDGMSEHYRVFEKFYTIRSQKSTETLLSQAQSQTEKAVQKGIEDGTQNAARIATEKAKADIIGHVNKFVNNAKKSIKNASKDAVNTAKESAEKSVKEKAEELTFKMSEHSVTILSIFAGIVLTVVAGLFYSSSVLESINEAEFYRLISVSALVGFVCFNLIAIMFRFLERIRNSPPSYLEDVTKKMLILSLRFLALA